MGRRKTTSRHLSIRLAEDVAFPLPTMLGLCGWSESRLINHLARIGILYLNDHPEDAADVARQYRDQVFANAVRAEAEAKIKAARAVGREDPDQMMLADAIDQAQAIHALNPPARDLAEDLEQAQADAAAAAPPVKAKRPRMVKKPKSPGKRHQSGKKAKR